MRKIYCPQCSIANLYVKNSQGKQRIVFVTSDYTVVAAKEGESLDGFNIELIYCLGCSWSGTPKELKKHQS